MKKTTILSVFILCACWLNNASAIPPTETIFSGGNGSSTNPYQIADLDDLKFLSENEGYWGTETTPVYFVQTDNIDASDTKTWNNGSGFLPIGSSSANFYGYYYGKGHTISHLYINRPSADNIGLFGYLYKSKIDSLGIVDCDITGATNVGGLAGYQDYCSGSSTDRCFSTGKVSGTNSVGGLVGCLNYGNNSISFCYSTAKVSGSTSPASEYIGGLVGKNYACSGSTTATTIDNCYSTGMVTGDTNIGGLVGGNVRYQNRRPQITDSYWNTDTISAGYGIDNANGFNAEGKTTIELQTASTYNSSWFTVIWAIDASKNDGYPYLQWQTFEEEEESGPFSGGEGTAADPYQIATFADLQYLSENEGYWDKYFIQTANIDADTTSSENYNSGKGFSPIGDGTNSFYGSYNGQGHVISNLTIETTDDNIGLFGCINGATIDSLGVTNCTISGSNFIGALVGCSSAGTISCCYSTGKVTGSSTTSIGIGGLIGDANCDIYYSYSSCDVVGYSTIGGLVGYSYGIINNCYSRGSVKSISDVASSSGSGGLVGLASDGTISYCYSTGKVTSDQETIGGLVGCNNAMVSSSFYDFQTSGPAKAIGTNGMFGESDMVSNKTTALMKLSTTYTCISWDFDDTWSIDETGTNNDGYPYLSWQTFESTGPTGPYILVDSAASAGGNGSTWAKAYNSLQDALDAAVKGDTIWVAKGTYYPSSNYGTTTETGSSYYHFELKDSVAIYGGFAGTESTLGERTGFGHGETNETILSGDFNGDDYIDTTAYFKIKSNDENCYHVFYHPSSLALDSTAVLDGVTITGGNAGVSSHNAGGGMYNGSSSPTLNNVTFSKNAASLHGGGMFNNSSSPSLNNVIFRENVASNSGGAMSDVNASPNLINVILWNNHANSGGAIYDFNSTTTLTNATICGNKAYSSSGTLGGGGILNDGSLSTITLKNCIVYGNTAKTNNGNEFYLCRNSKITLEYCCYSNNSNYIDGDNDFTTDDFTTDDYCITSDPKFVYVEDGDCRLYGNSPCVDAGNGDYNQGTTDIRGTGYGRKLDKYDHTAEGTIDMGAYEYKEGSDLMEPGAIIYVKTEEDGGSDSYDGETWASAYASLQKALEKAVSGKQIWMAAGTYCPTSPYDLTNTSRYYHFEMKEGVEIYGGFSGTEDPVTFDPADRDLVANKTILSGDIGEEGNNNDNCYHVFFHPEALNLTASAVLDGVTITGGNANIASGTAPHMYGGGMYNNNCSPILRNVIITGNQTSLAGTGGNGGGVYNCNSASPTLINVLICENSSDYGGGIYNSGSSPSPTLINVTISKNSSATYGGGIYNNKAVATLNNCIVWGNNSASSGTEIYNLEGSVLLNYSCYGSVSGTVTPDNNCVTDNPMFADTLNNDYRIYGNSPCVDAGNDDYNPGTSDIRGAGFGRKLLKTGQEQEGTIDMGAYEYKKGIDPLIFFVKTDGADNNDGYTWNTAFATLQKALGTAKKGNQVWVAKGAYQPSSAYSLTNSSRYYHFEMKDSVAIYGGFAGTETSVDGRAGFGPGGANETILSGNSGNCYHVIYNPSTLGLTADAVLDGFTITGGNANGDSPHNDGGGIYNGSSSPSLRNITVSGNSAAQNGGGIVNNNSSPILTNVIISGNSASGSGGGIYNDSSSPTFTNITISGNGAANGGGIANYNSMSILNNCIIWGNTATDNGGEIYISSDITTLNYSCYNNESGDVYTNNSTLVTTNNNITDDPMFVNPTNNDYRICGISPCADTGNNNYNLGTTDIRGTGFGRKLLKTDHAQSGIIDMGAYEYKEGSDPERPNITMYVDDSATGGNNDGSDWANAYTSLQGALTEATGGDTIYIAAGTYKPGTTRDSYFSMKNGMMIYGGFEGTEDIATFDLNDRDFTSNETILSGDIGTEGNNADNCYHVFFHPEGLVLDSTAVLDGVTITGGNADSVTYPYNSGGGMFNYYSSPTLTNVIITENTAIYGGGMFNRESSSSPKLTNVIISNNTASLGGGGIQTSGAPVLTNVSITGNVATQGGGMYNYCSSPTLINVTISGNKTTADGGGIYNRNDDASKYLFTLKNSIVWGNTSSTNEGNEFYLSYSDIGLYYSCYGNNDGDVQKGDNSSFAPDEHCITSDPNFADTAQSDYRLYGNSPCVNTGNTGYCTLSTDVRGQGRIQDGTIDMGAYEWTQGVDPVPLIRYVNGGVTGGGNDGTTWGNAFASLQDALDKAHNGDTIWVAAGTYCPTKQAGGTGDRFATFQMKNGVKIFGGLAGNESPDYDLSARDFTANTTILSGDIGTEGNNADNCYHVFFHPEELVLDSTAVLDGVTITGGYANGPSENYWHDCGGGILNEGASPSLVNVVISDNTADYSGGGICISSGSPVFTNAIIRGNTTIITGDEEAGTGGGIYTVASSPVFNNVTISGNTATNKGGGVHSNACSPLTMNNCIVWGNTASKSGNEIYLDATSVAMNYSCYGNGEGDIENDNSTFAPDANCITSDPFFADTTNNDYRLYGNSPCVNTGNAGYCTLSTDVRGKGRIQDGAADMGAYEWTQGVDPVPLIRYVNGGVTGGDNDGTTWGNAFASLQDALDKAHNGDTIWVAAGTYCPTKHAGGSGDRFATFQMKNGVKIFGGLAGNESPDYDLNSRDFTANTTILSGDIGTEGNNADNCYHVFFHPEELVLDSTAVLDGVTITGGYADGPWEDWHDCGGGMFNLTSSPTLSNVIVSGNTAVFYGGGICNVFSSSPVLNNLLISGNASAGTGGGLLCVSSSPVLNNVTISGNTATEKGGGVHSNACSPLTMNNCIVWGNTAPDGGNEIYLDITSVTMNYCCYGNGEGDIENDNSTFAPDANCITSDPFFADTTNNDYRLYGNSPCVNTGNAGYCTLSTDVRGKGRIQDGAADMGAYEWTQGVDPVPLIRYVNGGVTGGDNNGTTWGNAFASLQDGLDKAHNGDTIWVAAGTYCPTKQAGGSGDRFATFQMKNGVKIFGGLAGNESPDYDLNSRDFTANTTILSGDIGTEGNNADNCYHVFFHPEELVLDSTAVLDGVTITGGYADGPWEDWHDCGGGMFNLTSSPTLSNVIVSGNTAVFYGGGICNVFSSSPVLNNLLISGNASAGTGGGLLCVSSSPVLNNVTISGNTATEKGGGVHSNACSPLTMNNCIVWGNTAPDGGNEIYLDITSVTMNYCCYGNGEGDIENDNSTFVPDANCITSDPFFADTTNNDYRLYGNSPCVNTGGGTYSTQGNDIRGQARIQGGTVDMGAYEWAQGIDPGAYLKLEVHADTAFYLDSTGNTKFVPAGLLVSAVGGNDTTFSQQTLGCGNLGENKVAVSLSFKNAVIDTAITDTSLVTVLDSIYPMLGTKDSMAVYLSASGEASLYAAQLVTSAADNCPAIDTAISIVNVYKSAKPALPETPKKSCSFDCGAVGENLVEVKLEDASGNVTTDTAIATVLDTVAPVLVAKESMALPLGASGTAFVTAAQLVTSASDACGLRDTLISTGGGLPGDTCYFYCGDVGEENKITVKLTDNNGNVASGTVTVTVEDNILPELTAQGDTVYIDGKSSATVTVAQLVLSAGDNCSVSDTTVRAISINKSALPLAGQKTCEYSCGQTGTNYVEVTLADASGNIALDTVGVTVLDTTPPSLAVQNVTVYLGTGASASITAKDLTKNASDNCSVDRIEIGKAAKEKSANIVNPGCTFGCGDIGDNKVTVAAYDPSGNVTLDTAIVTVLDTALPVLETIGGTTVYLDSLGSATITARQLVSYASDNCPPDTAISIAGGSMAAGTAPLQFNYLDIGANSVEVRLSDPSGNTVLDTVEVTVRDTIMPMLKVRGADVYLDSYGGAEVSATDLVTYKWDNCPIASETLSASTFGCGDIGGNNVTVAIKDWDGNEIKRSVEVTVHDVAGPVFEGNAIEAYLDSTGSYELTGGDILAMFGNISDNCSGIDEMSLGAAPRSFTCEGLGTAGGTAVQLAAADANGNESQGSATVTVLDSLAPWILPVADIEIGVEAGTGATGIDYPEITYGDNCGASLTLVSGLGRDGLFPVGTTTEAWVAADASGNTDTVSFRVEVKEKTELATVKVLALLDGEAIPPSGITYLFYKKGDNGSLSSIGYSGTATGDTTVFGIVPGEWVILGSPVSNPATFVATYAYGATNWEDASPITLGKNETVGLVLNCVAAGETGEGTYSISGYVYRDSTATEKSCIVKTEADSGKTPMEGALAKLFKDGGASPLVTDLTDGEGLYSFKGLAAGTYYVEIDIPGLYQSGEYALALGEGNPEGSLSFVANYGTNAITDDEVLETGIGILMYPNPAGGEVAIEIGKVAGKIRLSVTGMGGKLEIVREYAATDRITIDMSGKTPGMYMVALDIDGVREVKKLIVKR